MSNIGRSMRMERALNPQSLAAGVANGIAIDRFPSSSPRGGRTAVLHVSCGAAAGTPSALTVDAKLQDSADGSTGWLDIGGNATQLIANNSASSGQNLRLQARRRWIRAVVTVGFTGGTSPTIPVQATIAFAGRR